MRFGLRNFPLLVLFSFWVILFLTLSLETAVDVVTVSFVNDGLPLFDIGFIELAARGSVLVDH
jgi:hypothetical protein